MLVAVRLRASTFASATVDRSRFGGQPSVSGAVYTASAGALAQPKSPQATKVGGEAGIRMRSTGSGNWLMVRDFWR